MTRSMTGFGRATGHLDGEIITAELSAVNHRYFECQFRLPYVWTAVEPALRELVKEYVSRGKVNVTIRRGRGPAGRPNVQYDPHVAEQYIAASCELAELMSTTESLSLNTLAGLEGVFYQEEEEEDLEKVRGAVAEVLIEALGQFNAARQGEGRTLAADITQRVTFMSEALAAIEARLPELAAAYEERLRARVAELNAEAGLKEERMALEVALMADKADVHEEVVRLKSHLAYAGELLDSPEPVGRDLNFLAQEIQRETNTLGAKLRDVGVTREVLNIKSELEKLREQVQNIE